MLRHRAKQTKSGKKDCTQFPPSRRGDHRRPPAGVQKRAIRESPLRLGGVFMHFRQGSVRLFGFPFGEGLDAAGDSAAAPTKSEADEGERKTALAGCFSLCAFSPQDAAGKKDADSARGASSPYSVRQKRLSAKKERSRGFSLRSAPFLRRITLRGIRRRQSG